MSGSTKETPKFTEEVIDIPYIQPLAMENEYCIKGPTDKFEPTGIQGTLVIPNQPTAKQLNENPNLIKRQQRVVVIAHGQNGHRNYVYQKVLAHTLAVEHGLYTFRFDFRNCGQSQNVDTIHGMTTYVERDDLTLVFDYLINKLKLIPAGLVGHSRGAQACMMWTLLQQARPDGGVYIPTVVNCSGRYRTELILDWYKKNSPDMFDGDNRYVLMPARRYNGQLTPYISQHETLTIAGYDLTQIKYLRKDTHVVTIHGDEDDIIPCEDAYLYDEALKGRHELHILKGANHNYVVTENHKSIIGGGEKKVKKSLVPEVVKIISASFSVEAENKRFFEREKTIGSTHNPVLPRWKEVEGVINFRDYGGYPIKAKRGTKRLWVKPGILFRSGKLDFITDKGMDAFIKLGIKQVFDVRSETELHLNDQYEEDNSSGPNDGLFHGPPGSGIVTTHVPLFSRENYSPEALAKRFQAYASNGFAKTYNEILQAGSSSTTFSDSQGFKQIFLWIRDNPGVPFLFHCSAGKDRTGIFAMLILLLLGVERDTIAHEYELSTIGYAPERDRIVQAAEAGFFNGRTELQFKNITSDGWKNLLSSRYETMIETMNMLDAKYGGVHHYLTNVVGLSEDDLEKIKSSLIYEGEPVGVVRTFYPSKIKQIPYKL